jgi:MFS family permease
MYTIAAIDRSNVGFGFAGMEKDLGISSTYAGLAGGIFFIGYMLLMIHGGIWAEKWSVKKFVAMQLVLWGIFSAMTGLVHNLTQLLTVRFFVGAAESGVWPATLILLARWFPLGERGRANAYFMLCFPIGAIIMSPLCGLILDHWTWRTMFILEGLPAVVWGVVWWVSISEDPRTAGWLSPEERNYILTTIEAEKATSKKEAANYAEAFKNRNVWFLVLSIFFWNIGFYGYILWLPTVVKSLSHGNNTLVGIISALPWVWAIIASIFIAKHSDKTGDRIKHCIWCMIISAACLLVSTVVGTSSPAIALVALILCLGFVWSYLSLVYAIPGHFLSGAVLGAAMGLLAWGNLGGFFGPFIFGYLKTLTGSFMFGMFSLIIAMVASGLLLLFVRSEVEKVPVQKTAIRAV